MFTLFLPAKLAQLPSWMESKEECTIKLKAPHKATTDTSPYRRLLLGRLDLEEVVRPIAAAPWGAPNPGVPGNGDPKPFANAPPPNPPAAAGAPAGAAPPPPLAAPAGGGGGSSGGACARALAARSASFCARSKGSR
jgi:hypothetical protein